MFKYKNIVYFFIIGISIGFLAAQTPTAVAEFEGKGISQSEASSLTDRLRSELFEFGTFQIIERGLMEEILTEQGFQQTGCTSDECVVEVGKLIGVQQIIGGSISKVGNIFSISARLIDVETGEVISIVTVDYEGNIGGLLKEGMRNVALKLVGEETIPFVSGFGSFYFTSEPNGANVWIDGKLMDGITPVLLENIPAGQRKILLEKDDLSFSESVGLLPQEIKRLNFVLEKSKGGVSIITTPLNAEVKIDGENKGLTPLTINDLLVGEYKLVFNKEGFIDHEQRISILKNTIEKIEVKLLKNPILNIESVPQNSTVTINEKIKTTPIHNYEIPPGDYFITVSKNKYEDYETEVVMKPDSIMNIMVHLIRKTGSLKIDSAPNNAKVYLNNEFVGLTPFFKKAIPTGEYYVKLKLDQYLPDSITVNVNHNKQIEQEFELVSFAEIQKMISKQKAKKKIWLYSAGAAGLLGGTFQLSSNLHYQQYKDATLKATDLHRTIDRENVMYPIGYGLSTLCLAKSFYHLREEKKLENILNTK